MSSNSRIPQLLTQYVQNLPRDSLVLATSTLSNSVNWLIVRYLCSAFSNDALKARSLAASQELKENAHSTTTDVGVVLVSWMRDWEYWKTEARRAGGLDLASLSQHARFAFVDGMVAASDQAVSVPPGRPTTPSARQATVASSAGAARNPLPATLRSPADNLSSNLHAAAAPSSQTHTTASTELSRVRDAIDKALSSLKTESALLIIDGLDVLLPLQNSHTSSSQSAPSSAILALLMSLRLRPRVNSTILSLQSDINPLGPAMPDQHNLSPLEIDSRALLAGVAHTADLVISVRGLDTGAAGDVGGVLRVTKGTPRDEDTNMWKEQELLYLVKPDGSAKVWERGAGVGVG